MIERAPLDAARVRAALAARWARIDVVDETTSTNADLLADHDAPDRSVLVAEYQSAGRGRFERVWSSPPRSGVILSALLRPDVELLHWGWLPLLVGVALAEAVGETAGVQTALKWPNDLLIEGGKAAGILVQSAGEVAVVGIGLNVSTTADELPGPGATSLLLAGARTLDRSELLIAILARLDARVVQWIDCGGDAAACGLADAYRASSATIGAQVRVHGVDGATLEGRAVDIDPGGRLVLRPADNAGNIDDSDDQHVGAGDVEHLRPAGNADVDH